MEKRIITAKDPKDMSIGELFAEKTVSVLKDVSKKSEQAGRKAGLLKLQKRFKHGFKLRWTCGACRAHLDNFQGSEGIQKMRDYLKKLDVQGYIPCPSNGKKHLNRFEVEKDAVVFKMRLSLTEEKPSKVKK